MAHMGRSHPRRARRAPSHAATRTRAEVATGRTCAHAKDCNDTVLLSSARFLQLVLTLNYRVLKYVRMVLQFSN